MNKKQLIFSAILAAAAVGASAAPVSKSTAINTARMFLQHQTGAVVNADQVHSVNGAYYVVNMLPQGWVIVSADDTAEPIIGYSNTGHLTWTALPTNMKGMLDSYASQVKQISRATSKKNIHWNSVGTMYTRDDNGAVESLIKVHWNQNTPFNKYCPGSGNTKALVGCVAVAISQAISVQQYPTRPQGHVNYTPPGYSNIDLNFDNEKSYDWNAILSGANQYDEAARLLYHAGVAVRMRYGHEGSGVLTTQLYLIADALKNHFTYGDDVVYYLRDQYQAQHGRVAWERLLLNELNAGRAIIYNGTGEAGHSFNIDGYDGNGRFHLNWGWGGTGDGYFTLDALHDEYQGISFPNNHSAIIGIGTPNRELRSIELDETSIDEGLPAGSVVANVLVNGAAPKPSYSFSVSGLYSNGSYARVPFEIRNNQLVTTEVLSASTKAQYDIDVRVTESNGGTRLAQTFTIIVQPFRTIEAATTLAYDRASGRFDLRTKHNVSYVIRSAAGSTVLQGTLDALPRLTFTKDQLAAGVNTVELRCGSNEVKTFTIVK